MSIQIIIDSTTNVRDTIKDKMSVVPLTVSFGDKEYIEDVTLTRAEFYQKLIESDVLPKTSAASPAAFEEEIKKVVDAGDTAIVITVASRLSATCQNAVIAASEYEGKAFVVDSENVAIGTGILAEYAYDLIMEGKPAEEIVEILEKEKKKVRLVALLDTLEYLKKGGRISATAAFAGTLLNLKPVVEVRDGVIEALGKARGSKQGNNLLVKEIEKSGGVDFDKPVLLGYTGLSEHMLQKYITDSEHLWKHSKDSLYYEMIGSVIGTHAGPGAIAAAFFAKN